MSLREEKTLRTYLAVNSADRFVGGSSTNFTVNLTVPVPRVTEVQLLTAAIPKTMYNVTTANNVLDYNVGGAAQTAIIPPGSYNIASLVVALNTALNAGPANDWTVAVNTTTFLVTISKVAGTENLLFGTGANLASSIGPLLGFPAVNQTGSLSYTGTSVLNLSLPYSVFIVINRTPATSTTTAGLTGFTFNVPIADTLSGDLAMFTANNTYDATAKIAGRQDMKTLSIQLCDRTGAVINLNGAEWEMLLVCTSFL